MFTYLGKSLGEETGQNEIKKIKAEIIWDYIGLLGQKKKKKQ